MQSELPLTAEAHHCSALVNVYNVGKTLAKMLKSDIGERVECLTLNV